MKVRALAAGLVFCLGLCAAAAGGAEEGEKFRIEVRPPRPGPGQMAQVRALAGELQPAEVLEARLCGRSFPLWKTAEGSWEGLVSLDRDEKSGARELSVVALGKEGERLLGSSPIEVGEREYGIQQLSVDEGMVTLSPENEARAERENKLIRTVLAERTADRFWSFPFLVPAQGHVSGPFGVRRVYNGKPKSYHGGTDIAAPKGAPVTATAAGRVALVGDFYYTGLTALVDHGCGLYSAYFHMSALKVAQGDRVEAGQLLGLVGSTGRSTGPHLHWGMYLSGLRVDPESVTALNPVGGPAE
ncbi:MAG: M23 family metallopeptidase [Deltaproteobacteria bacterium]|nr:M23 family metallopeptidase [Deltaproteobacteria bacterium]